MEPIVLFGIQFTLSLAAYGLIASGTWCRACPGCRESWLSCHCCGSTPFASLAGRSWLRELSTQEFQWTSE